MLALLCELVCCCLNLFTVIADRTSVLCVIRHCCSASQDFPQEWWSTTFKQAVADIGHTVLRLAPWESGATLSRAWCLWELYCTIAVGAKFSVSFGDAERQAFHETLLDPQAYTAVEAAFAKIDVREATAGSPADEAMIKAAVRGVERPQPEDLRSFDLVNATVMATMRAELQREARLAPGGEVIITHPCIFTI